MLQLLVVGGAVLLLALFVQAPRFRAIFYRGWAWAIGLGALFSMARVCPITWT